jgi:hypothetical protein
MIEIRAYRHATGQRGGRRKKLPSLQKLRTLPPVPPTIGRGQQKIPTTPGFKPLELKTALMDG